MRVRHLEKCLAFRVTTSARARKRYCYFLCPYRFRFAALLKPGLRLEIGEKVGSPPRVRGKLPLDCSSASLVILLPGCCTVPLIDFAVIALSSRLIWQCSRYRNVSRSCTRGRACMSGRSIPGMLLFVLKSLPPSSCPCHRHGPFRCL